MEGLNYGASRLHQIDATEHYTQALQDSFSSRHDEAIKTDYILDHETGVTAGQLFKAMEYVL